MALKPTIYKVQVALADSDRGCFEELALTIARHPSETLERMTARLLAYCLEYAPGLEFTRGLSTTDEPDLWLLEDNGEIGHWIELGQPEEARLRKACGRATRVSVYAFGKSAPTWWKLNGTAISALPGIRVVAFEWAEVLAAARLVERTVRLSASIVGGTVYLDNGGADCQLELQSLAG